MAAGRIAAGAILWATERRLWLLLAALLGAGEAAGLAAQTRNDLHLFVLIALAQGAVYAVAVALLARGRGARPNARPNARPGLAFVLVVAAALRLGPLLAPVALSTDIYRYVWDGRVAAAGINPYRYIPTDPHLLRLRDPVIFPRINRNNYALTIYPPVAQMLFLLAHVLGGGVMALKLLFVALEAVGIAALVFVLGRTGRPRETILIYAWHPLPIWEIAGSGHVDAAVVAFVGLALAAAVSGRRAGSGAALAAATLIKFLPAVIAPALWRWRDRRFVIAFIMVAIAAYLPYIDVGRRVLGFLPGYVKEERLSSGGGFWALDLARQVAAVPATAYFAVAVLVMAGLALAALRRPPGAPASLSWAMILATAATVLASPHYPWYFVWLVALLSVAPWGPALWPTLTAFLLYWDPRTGYIPGWVEFTIYGGFFILAVGERVVRLRGRGERHGIRRAG
ncbi:MAG: glycosyltransferase 87 family protein [Stellaceae bacterium]